MSLSLRRYGLMLFMQMSFIIIDLTINTLATCIRNHSVVLLVIYLFQDVCIIFALITLVISYFSTYQFQAGMVELLFEREKVTIAVTVCYLFLTIAWQYWSLTVHWDKPHGVEWSTGMIILYDIQRTSSVFYYYLYKKSTLFLSDPKLYRNVTSEGSVEMATVDHINRPSTSRHSSQIAPEVTTSPRSSSVKRY